MKELSISQMENLQGGWVLVALAVWFLAETLNNPSESVNSLMSGYNYTRNK